MADPNTTEAMVALLARIGNVYPLLDISGVSRYQTHQHILEELKNKFIQAIITEHWNQEKEIAMIFQDPIVYKFLSSRIIEALKECIFEFFNDTNKTVEGINIHGTIESGLTNLLKNPNVKWISTMVTLGSKSHEILRLNNASIPRVDERIYSSFYEKLLYWTYDDNGRAPETARIMKQEIHEDNKDVPDLNFMFKFGTNEINILKNNDFATKVLGSYLLDRCQHGDIIALKRALYCFDIVKTIDSFILQLIINELIDHHFIQILYSIK
ncbi:15380_t:CDS:2, partial [Gigaspora margarita]